MVTFTGSPQVAKGSREQVFNFHLLLARFLLSGPSVCPTVSSRAEPTKGEGQSVLSSLILQAVWGHCPQVGHEYCPSLPIQMNPSWYSPAISG
jgi:hypothetical protein